MTLFSGAYYEDRASNCLNSLVHQVSVSIIIPFHGAESELRRCLLSLYGQTALNFEVIIVADGVQVTSTVGDELRASGKRVRIIRNEIQSGAFESRCSGGALAEGKYLWFMDHDDTVDEDFVKTMLDTAQENFAQIVECPLLVVPESGHPYIFKKFATERALRGEQILREFLNGRSHNNLSNKIIERRLFEGAIKLIGDVNDKALNFAEDMLCIVFIYSQATSYQSIEGVHYNYLQRSDSTWNTRDLTRVAQSLRSLAVVLSKMDLLLSRHAQQADVEVFLGREVRSLVDHLVERANGKLTAECDALVGLLRAKYLDK